MQFEYIHHVVVIVRTVAWAAFLGCLPLIGCGAEDPTTTAESSDTAEPPEPHKPCEFESDCAHLGLGHMCMSGMCMGMVINSAPVVQPPPSEQSTVLVPLTDLNPAPELFEADLVAVVEHLELVPGVLTEVFAYKDAHAPMGTIPGPLIDVEIGTTVRINFTNLLPQPTTVHWHGIRLPNAMDGVPGLTQEPILPGETFVYEFTVLDAALYWYHPHFRSDEQVERGLYGLLRVRERTPPEVNAERLFALDDILLDESGQIAGKNTNPAHYFDHERGMMMMDFTAMMGRQGNRLLLNGKANPIIHVKAGHVERWSFANTSNSRFFKVALEQHRLTQIGSDGGMMPVPQTWLASVLVPNAERVEVLVQFNGQPGDQVQLVTQHHQRGHDLADPGDLPLALIVYDPEPATDALPVPDTTRYLPKLREIEPTHYLELGERMAGDKVEFTINGEIWPNGQPEQATVGGYEVWEIKNTTHMDHPFHLHGVFFQPLSIKLGGHLHGSSGGGGVPQWKPYEVQQLKDTILVPPTSSIRLGVLWNGYAGSWLYHCHIFEHAHGGMMGRVRVDPTPSSCTRGESRCLGDMLQACDIDTMTWLTLQECRAGCDEQAQTPACLPVCAIGASQCNANSVERCEPLSQTDPSEGAWTTAEVCTEACIPDPPRCPPARQ